MKRGAEEKRGSSEEAAVLPAEERRVAETSRSAREAGSSRRSHGSVSSLCAVGREVRGHRSHAGPALRVKTAGVSSFLPSSAFPFPPSLATCPLA